MNELKITNKCVQDTNQFVFGFFSTFYFRSLYKLLDAENIYTSFRLKIFHSVFNQLSYFCTFINVNYNFKR